MCGDSEEKWKEVSLDYLKLLPQNLYGGIEENEIRHWSLITV